jgi:hypothetical protein
MGRICKEIERESVVLCEAGTFVIMAFKIVSPQVKAQHMCEVWYNCVVDRHWVASSCTLSNHLRRVLSGCELFITQQDLHHLSFDSYHRETRGEKNFSESSRTLICCILILKRIKFNIIKS